MLSYVTVTLGSEYAWGECCLRVRVLVQLIGYLLVLVKIFTMLFEIFIEAVVLALFGKEIQALLLVREAQFSHACCCEHG